MIVERVSLLRLLRRSTGTAARIALLLRAAVHVVLIHVLVGGRLLRAALPGRRRLAAVLATRPACRRLLIVGRSLLRALAARRRLGLTALRCRRLLIGGSLLLHPALAAGCALCAALASRALGAALHPAHRHAERSHGLLVDRAGRLEALLPLECDQGFFRARAEPAIDCADVETLLLEHDLDLPDFIHAQIHRAAADRRSATE